MKLVREYLDFERGLDPKEAMGIGKDRKIQKGDIFPVYDYKAEEIINVEALDNEISNIDPGLLMNIDPDHTREVYILLPNGDKWFAIWNKQWILGES